MAPLLGKAGLIGLGIGAALGTALIKFWPKLEPALQPVVKKGLDIADKGLEKFWEKSEKVADAIAEMKERQQPKAEAAPVQGTVKQESEAPAVQEKGPESDTQSIPVSEKGKKGK